MKHFDIFGAWTTLEKKLYRVFKFLNSNLNKFLPSVDEGHVRE